MTKGFNIVRYPVAKPKKTATAAALAAMMAIAVPLITTWEGVENVPYTDIVGVRTVCVGETQGVEERYYSDEECAQMLRDRIPDYAMPVADAMPGIENSPYEWAAYTSAAYNFGAAAFRRSSMVRLYNQGKRVEACRFLRNYNRAGGQVVRGLQFRREGDGARLGEYEVCLAGAITTRF